MKLTRLLLKLTGLLCLLAILSLWLISEQAKRYPTLTMAFTSNRNGNSQIYVMDPGTGHTLQATGGQFDSSQPAWGLSEDLFYASYPAPLHLAVLKRSGWQSQLLSQPLVSQSSDEYQPDTAPDGRIAAATNLNLNWDIVIYNPDGTHRLANFNTQANELEPCWWDNDHLSFVSDRDGSYDIFWYDLVTQAVTNLTNNPASDYNPSCSQENRLAFTSLRDLNAEIYVIDLPTGEAHNITQNPANDFNPAWLPDKRLSFVSDREGNREIYVLDLASGALINMTRNPAEDNQPAWSKSG